MDGGQRLLFGDDGGREEGERADTQSTRRTEPTATVVEPVDPNVVESDRVRLRGQSGRILDRLRSGPATNSELARISLKYTSRISDLRKHLERSGMTVECDRGTDGLNTYRIVRR